MGTKEFLIALPVLPKLQSEGISQIPLSKTADER
jgi:hypothetical protein